MTSARAALALGALLAMMSPSQIFAATDELEVSAGRSMAETWCSGCHNIQPTGKTVSPAPGSPPDFSLIANSVGTTELGLNAFLQTPHARMPDFQLSRVQVSSLISYILSLKGK